MNLLRGSSIGLAALIAGCSTVSPKCAVPRASGDSAATVVIYRPGAFTGVLYGTPLAIDHCRVETIWNHSCAVYRLPAGQHHFATERRAGEYGGTQSVTADLKAGDTYYLRQRSTFESVVKPMSTLAFVLKDEALQDRPALADLDQCKAP